MTRNFKKENLDEMDMDAYLASGSSDEGEGNSIFVYMYQFFTKYVFYPPPTKLGCRVLASPRMRF